MEPDLDTVAERWQAARSWEEISAVKQEIQPTWTPAPREMPVGAAVLLIDMDLLHLLLNLPEAVHVHHTFLAPLHYGSAIGLQLISYEPGQLPDLPPRNCELDRVDLECQSRLNPDGSVSNRVLGISQRWKK